MRLMLAFLFTLIISSASASPFRVLVFPHHGTYSTPEGRESVVSKVSVTSTQNCSQYAATLNQNHEWEKSGDLLTAADHFSLSTNTVKKLKRSKLVADTVTALYFECSAPFKVVRESALTSYSYEGSFVAVIDEANKKIQLVNLIDPENYLQGVVPAEVGNEWPEEALKAQAVAARTFSWWTVLRARSLSASSLYDLDDTVEYQAYEGTANHTAATEAAVSGTIGQVMKYQGKVIRAFFSADSGGKTESAENAFGEPLPYCVIKTELYDVTKANTNWTDKVSFADIGKAFGQSVGSLEVLATDVEESGRAKQVTITTTEDKVVKISGTVFRLALKLRSTLFQLKNLDENGQKYAQITGKGYGHGVGLAQIGAKQYALQMGWTFDQIVKFYYTGITLESVNNAYFE